MIPTSRRQRYFRPTSPPIASSSSGGAGNSHQSMNPSNLNVLEQAELVIDGGDDQQVSHEEIVDDGSSEMVVDHHHHQQQQHPQLRANPMHHHHYDNRQPTSSVYQQQAQNIRRAGRPIAQRPQGYAPNPMDMVQKLQNKSVYMPQQRPQTRISPAGARIVSFAGRKRENPEVLPAGIKKMNMAPPRQHSQSQQHQPQSQQQAQQIQKNVQSVKVVRLATSAARANPTASEHALIDIENNIKQTIEDSKIDLERLQELREADFSQDEYHQYLGMLLLDLERANEANMTLTNFYRDRQRHEKTIYEARENAFAARIRQLETENRKLRDSTHAMYYAKFNEAGGHNNMYRNDHMSQMMVEEPEEHVVIEGHVDNHQESEEVPQEWIVEETVEEHRMHLQDLDTDEHPHLEQQQQQQDEEETEDVKSSKNMMNDQFGEGSGGGGGGGGGGPNL